MKKLPMVKVDGISSEKNTERVKEGVDSLIKYRAVRTVDISAKCNAPGMLYLSIYRAQSSIYTLSSSGFHNDIRYTY